MVIVVVVVVGGGGGGGVGVVVVGFVGVSVVPYVCAHYILLRR